MVPTDLSDTLIVVMASVVFQLAFWNICHACPRPVELNNKILNCAMLGKVQCM